MALLSEETGAFVGHWYPVLGVNIKLFFSSSQFLLKLVNVGNLHPVHERQPLQSEKTREARKRQVSTHICCELSDANYVLSSNPA